VKRVVLTSSFAAIGYGHEPKRTAPFTEADWTKIGADTSAYVKSKTLAERAAWEFVKREGGPMELSVVNPVAVFGPVLGADYSSSVEIVGKLLRGAVPAVPLITFGVVDVRDVAALHLLAMTHPAAAGERFLATAGDFFSVKQIADVLRDKLGAAARRVPTLQLADWFVRSAALVSPTARSVLPELGKIKNGSNEKARRLLGWTPRSSEEAIVACARSLLERGLVPG
jgi:dihydroflavonol-4-reductase